MTSRILVVMVTYNAEVFVTRALDSLRSQTLAGQFDTRIVDNASCDGTVEVVTSRYPEAELIASPVNLGFAAGNNRAFLQVLDRYDMVVLLNSDAIASPTFLQSLVEHMEGAGDRVAAVTARVRLAARFRHAVDGEVPQVVGPEGAYCEDPAGDVRLLNSTGNIVLDDGYGVDRSWLIEDGEGVMDRPDQVFGLCGAAVAIRSTALREVGGFDERLFLYYEDTDLSWRLRLQGWSIEYCPTAVVDHIHSASTSEGSELFRFYNERNRLLVLAKNSTWPRILRAWLRFPLSTASLRWRRHAPRSIWGVRRRAYRSALGLLPGVLRTRWSIRPRTSRRAVEGLIPRTRADASLGAQQGQTRLA